MTDRTPAPEPGSAAPSPEPPPRVVDLADMGGEPVCWLPRVCPECGRLSEREPPTTCDRCGAEIGVE